MTVRKRITNSAKHSKSSKEKVPKQPPLNLSGVKFEDALRVMLATPAPKKPKV
jgi:hypothetical protein